MIKCKKGRSIMKQMSVTEPTVKVKVEFDVSLNGDTPKMLNNIGQMLIKHGQALIVANDSSKGLQQNIEENECCLPFN